MRNIKNATISPTRYQQQLHEEQEVEGDSLRELARTKMEKELVRNLKYSI